MTSSRGASHPRPATSGWPWFGPVLLTVLVGLPACSPAAEEVGVDEVLHAIRVAEDNRDTTGVALAPVLAGMEHPDVVVRRTSARALGRMEAPELIEALLPGLADVDASVRTATVNALAQAGHVRGWPDAWAALTEGLAAETDPEVRAVYGQSLGRLPYDDPEAHAAAEALLMELVLEPVIAMPQSRTTTRALSLARGLESLARTGGAFRALEPATRAALTSLAAYTSAPEGVPGEEDARVRRAALLAFITSGPALDRTVLARALEDEDDEVRRVAARGLAALPDPSDLLALALADPGPRVRWEAIRILGAQRELWGCAHLFAATEDVDPHVRILAFDQLAQPCRQAAEQLATLLHWVDQTPPDGEWQPWAHAVVALARLSPQEAGAGTRRLAEHSNPFARAWAAQAATAIPDASLLRELANDPVANVRTAALQGLSSLEGHGTDALAIANLASDDAQLVLTATETLVGTPRPDEALPDLLRALERFTETGRQTSRDVRIALLERISELGSKADVEAVRPYLTDFDPHVAELAAAALAYWGTPAQAAPVPPAPAPFPDPATLDRLSRSSVVLEMESGGEVEIRLFPYVAPTNAARFARLAASGYFNGLTFHRIVPNFVVQGGSPGANEYWGAGPFSRDELNLQGNWRGTVGLSTRGRDTGDAQIYFNTVDNLRLDHDYTIYGEVVRGIEVVDLALEGAVILRATVIEGG